MTDGKQNQIKSDLDSAKGEIKDQFGKLIGDKSTQASGKKDKAKGSIRRKYGEAQEKVNDEDKSEK